MRAKQTVLGFFLGIAFLITMANFQGDLILAGIQSDGVNYDFFNATGTFRVRSATVDIDGAAVNFDAAIEEIDIEDRPLRTFTSTSFTSPTVSMSVATLGWDAYVTVTSDANQNTHLLTGGSKGQKVHLIAGAGSNTLRYDDATSFTLGGNITLTEGQGDVLTVICTTDDGDEWVRLANVDN